MLEKLCENDGSGDLSSLTGFDPVSPSRLSTLADGGLTGGEASLKSDDTSYSLKAASCKDGGNISDDLLSRASEILTSFDANVHMK